MTDRFVGPGGSDGNSGLTWALRKLTLNGVEDSPVAAGDNIYVGPGTYRERLTIDQSGSSGQPITYIADVTGVNTDGVGGPVIISMCDSASGPNARTECMVAAARDFRTFRGFIFHGDTSGNAIEITGDSDDWIIEQCIVAGCFNLLDLQPQALGSNITVRRCYSHEGGALFYFFNGSGTYNSLIENMVLGNGISSTSVANSNDTSINVINNTIVRGSFETATNAVINGSGVRSDNVIEQSLRGLQAGGTPSHNAFDAVSVGKEGTDNISYGPFYQPLILCQGYKIPYQFLYPVYKNDSVRLTPNVTPTEDLWGLSRPATASKISKGALQEREIVRETTTVRAGTSSMKLDDSKRSQMIAVVKRSSRKWRFEVFVYRETDYAGSAPQVIIKRPGQSDVTLTDSGGSGSWNKLTTSFTPQSTDKFYIIELVSRNTATSGNYAVYFDDFVVDNGRFGQLFTFMFRNTLIFSPDTKALTDTWVTPNTPPIIVSPGKYISGPMPTYFKPV